MPEPVRGNRPIGIVWDRGDALFDSKPPPLPSGQMRVIASPDSHSIPRREVLPVLRARRFRVAHGFEPDTPSFAAWGSPEGRLPAGSEWAEWNSRRRKGAPRGNTRESPDDCILSRIRGIRVANTYGEPFSGRPLLRSREVLVPGKCHMFRPTTGALSDTLSAGPRKYV